MHFVRVDFVDFRNLHEAQLCPDPTLNVLWGENAQGKTNILEGIYLLGHLRSFRSVQTAELIRHQAGTARLRAQVEIGGVLNRVALDLSATGKAFRVNDKALRSARELDEGVRQVLFSPEEVGLIKGGPAGRRRLIDRGVFQTDSSYLVRNQEYGRCLKQRNRCLKAGANGDLLAPWTESLIRLGARIRVDRARFIDRITPMLQQVYAEITGGREAAELAWQRSGTDEQQEQEKLREELRRFGPRELQLGTTLAGPHRDDFSCRVDGLDLRTYGSQGQQRSFILAFKSAQIADLERLTGRVPVLLLDDLTSELDHRRKEYFFNFLLTRGGQVFITTTDPAALAAEGLRGGRLFRVHRGTLSDDNRGTRNI